MDSLRAWARQPTTVAGISALVATISALFLKQLSWIQAAPLLAGAVASILLPDNSSAGPQAKALVGELVTDLVKTKETK
jgi:hypothetical protein